MDFEGYWGVRVDRSENSIFSTPDFNDALLNVNGDPIKTTEAKAREIADYMNSRGLENLSYRAIDLSDFTIHRTIGEHKVWERHRRKFSRRRNR